MIEQNPILEQGQSQQIESQILDGTIPSRFQQKLLPLSGNFKNQKNDSKTQIPINGPEDLFIITTCDVNSQTNYSNIKYMVFNLDLIFRK